MNQKIISAHAETLQMGLMVYVKIVILHKFERESWNQNLIW